MPNGAGRVRLTKRQLTKKFKDIQSLRLALSPDKRPSRTVAFGGATSENKTNQDLD